MSVRILLAEDDVAIRNGLVDTLESEGYDVVAAADGRAAIDRWNASTFDMVILDVMMPSVNGYDVCRTIRKKDEQVPILMLTAKGEELDKVVGLELGADDYVTKPFGIHELLARVAALLRRSRARSRDEQDGEDPEQFPFAGGEVDGKSFHFRRAGQEYPLTRRELSLLQLFHRHPGEVLSRDRLLNHAWGVEYYGTTRTLDQHIAQLRKKIEPGEAGDPVYIHTVYGVGYRYHPADG